VPRKLQLGMVNSARHAQQEVTMWLGANLALLV